jgi:nitroreductase
MVFNLIRTKRAVRQFSDQPVADYAIRRILDAGRRAQSSKNSQPWHFVVVREVETLRQLGECGRYAGHLAGARFAIALITEAADAFDIGQAAAYMQLAAWEMGIGSCIAAMWEPEKAKTILNVPESMHFDYAISFGYPAEPQAPPRKGGRRPLENVVRWDEWDQQWG